MEKTLDYATALALLEQSVAERGENYVYSYPNGCQNVWFDAPLDDDGCELLNEATNLRPGCIVGNVIGLSGFDLKKLIDDEYHESGSDITLSYLQEQGHWNLITEAARRLLLRAQLSQDRKVPWFLAVKYAQEGSDLSVFNVWSNHGENVREVEYEGKTYYLNPYRDGSWSPEDLDKIAADF